VWFQGEKRALYCLISIAKQSFSVHCHLRHLRGTLKIVFQLKLLNARASPQLREPDNLRTFASSPRVGFTPMSLFVPLLEFNHYRNFSIMVPLLRLPAHSPEKRMTDGNFGQISEACRTSGGGEKWNSKVPS
jgi:hypothetical protein